MILLTCLITSRRLVLSVEKIMKISTWANFRTHKREYLGILNFKILFKLFNFSTFEVILDFLQQFSKVN